MSKTLSFMLFFSIVTIVVGSIHYYFWIKLIKNTGMPQLWKSIGISVLVVLLLYLLTAMLLSQYLSTKYSQPLLWIAYLWMGIMMLLFITLLFTDLIKVILYFYSKFTISNEFAVDIERRQFISGLLALGSSAIVLIASGISVINYYSKPFVNKIQITLSGLPKIFNGFKIVQISDLHIGQLMTRSKLEEIVQQVNSLEPDLIAITGDLVDGSIKLLSNEVKPIMHLKAKKGIFFVTGNHEYYSGVENWISEIEKFGIRVLSNENIEINDGNDSFYIAGVNDHEAKRFGEKHAADFNKTLSGLDKNRKVILLAHQPIAVREAAEYGVDLVLSGHTHGGQIWPFNYLVYFQQPYIKGFYAYKKTKLFVNQGTGCWGPPMRLGTKNEITEVTLYS
jgi:predicted MPP superfamily phosphohydrolase